jgi:hypothetical protein
MSLNFWNDGAKAIVKSETPNAGSFGVYKPRFVEERFTMVNCPGRLGAVKRPQRFPM